MQSLMSVHVTLHDPQESWSVLRSTHPFLHNTSPTAQHWPWMQYSVGLQQLSEPHAECPGGQAQIRTPDGSMAQLFFGAQQQSVPQGRLPDRQVQPKSPVGRRKQ